MTRSIGPLDGRIKRTRCTACIKGHLKCNGGTPCKYCVRTGQPCIFAQVAKSVVFVDAMTKAIKQKHSQGQDGIGIPRYIVPDEPSRYITYFNTFFLCSNSFTGSSADQFRDVHPILRGSPALQYAVMAVSVLHFEKNRYPRKPANQTSLQYYRAGISAVQADLARHDLRKNASVLWSTFFLGIFELMCDASGDGWIKHFLYGTSVLLKHRGPAAHLTGVGRRFLITTRIFEISRALVYSDETFLAQEEWRMLAKRIWSGKSEKEWHPKEALFDLMINCSTLSIRAMKYVHSMRDFLGTPDENVMHEMAQEGFYLRYALSAWRIAADEWPAGARRVLEDSQMIIAMSYYHAVSIFLSGTFDYHTFWSACGIHTPILSSKEVQDHVIAILHLVGLALKQGILAGILFFFPLRVAGARARTLEQRCEISRFLYLISSRGFVVANTFVADLDKLWDSKPIE